jgi:septal ring factor EnvC (AmiA/AmiB activator)
VTFQYKSDGTNTPQFGLIAEEVAEVNPDLVVRDKNGEIYTVRYDAVNAMLLNEFLKEHRKVEEQQAAITELKSGVVQQQKEFQAAIAEQRKEMEARLKQQDAKIQTVNDRIELSKPAPQTVASNE